MDKMQNKHYYISIILLLITETCNSQFEIKSTNEKNKHWPLNQLNTTANLLYEDSGIVVTYYTKGICKNYFIRKEFIPYPTEIKIVNNKKVPELKRTNFLTVHGNIYYDYFYRSKIDTPFKQEDFRQHTESLSGFHAYGKISHQNVTYEQAK
jgi:hypothetical protein